MTAVLRANRLKSFDTSVLVTGCLVLIVISMVIPLSPAILDFGFALSIAAAVLIRGERDGAAFAATSATVAAVVVSLFVELYPRVVVSRLGAAGDLTVEGAAASPYACQVQGVYVDPDRRGEGLAAPGIAAVVALAMRDIAPVVSLYVNGHNLAARRAYERAGFEQSDTFTTIMF